MKRPLPPELVRIGDELERDVREQVVDRPVRRQLALGLLAMFVITVPTAVSVTGAELNRPVAQFTRQDVAVTSDAALTLQGRRPADDVLPRSLRRPASTDSTRDYLVEPSPLRPALR